MTVGTVDVVALIERDREALEKDARGVDAIEARAVKQAANDEEVMQEIIIIMEAIVGGDVMTIGSQEMMMTRAAKGDEILAIAVEVPVVVRIEAVFTAESITTIVKMTMVILRNAAAQRRRARSVAVATTAMVNRRKGNNREVAATANGRNLGKARIVTQGGHLMRMEPMERLNASIHVNVTLPRQFCSAMTSMLHRELPDPITSTVYW